MSNNNFAVYAGREYRVARIDDQTFALISEQASNLGSGFKEERPGVYVKRVDKKDIQHAYARLKFCDYKNQVFSLIEERDGKALIETGDYRLFLDFGMKQVDNGVYELWVDLGQLGRIWEDRKPIFGFNIN